MLKFQDDQDLIENYKEIVERQRQFFYSGKTAPFEYRLAQLKKLKNIFIQEKEAFAEAVYKDLRRTPETSYILEIDVIISEFDYFIENFKNWIGPHHVERTLLTLFDTVQVFCEPKGVVLLIGPWNYPLWTILGPLISIIAGGNTVIIKPSELAPHVADLMHNLFSKIFDKNYLMVIKGGVIETTELLKEKFDHIMYTGSTQVGQIIMNAAAKHLTPVTLELGGKSPTIVLADADIDISARRIAWGKWVNCGQTCIAPDYIITTADVKPKLVSQLVASLRNFYGSNIKHNKEYSRIISLKHHQRLSNLLKESKSLILFKGGEIDEDDLFIPPYILDSTLDDIFMKDEIFGPILPIITVENIEEAIKFIQGKNSPLALYLFTRSETIIDKVISSTQSGGVCVNDVILHAAVRNLPFGGVGKSGMGRIRGKFGFAEFTHEKPILKRGFFGEILVSARYPPLNKKKVAYLATIVSYRKFLPSWVWRIFYILPSVCVGAFTGYYYNSLNIK